ncbi:hypothetical protein [Nostoc sp.]|uniref:hypothetical protein n=1 Tax=Nostoc sp. TaxID=1180 RepID=UPI002FF47280
MGNKYIKELLSTLTIDERCGVMLEFEDVCPDKFTQLVIDTRNGLNGWRDFSAQKAIAKRSVPPK